MAELRTIASGPNGEFIINADQIEVIVIRSIGREAVAWYGEIYMRSGKVVKTGEWDDRVKLSAALKYGVASDTPETPEASIGG